MRLLAIGVAAAVALAALTIGIVLSVPDTVELLNAMSTFAWPVLVLFLLLRLSPTIGDVIRSRKLEVEIGGVRISVLELLEQLPRQLDDLRLHSEPGRGVSADDVRGGVQASAGGSTDLFGRILWVDDRPEANVYEKQTLLDDGWRIDSAVSTHEAVSLAADAWSRYDVVVSDMGREEDGRYVSDAGIQLVRRIRETGSTVPFFVYTSRRGWERRSEAIEAGADGLTSSPSELLSFVRRAVSR